MSKIAISPAGAAPAIGPYSHAVRLGDLLFCSGQIPIDPANPSGPVPTDVKEQSRIVLENIQRILKSEGLDFRHVVKSTVFLTNLADFQSMNELYSQYFVAPYPPFRSQHFPGEPMSKSRSSPRTARWLLRRDSGIPVGWAAAGS